MPSRTHMPRLLTAVALLTACLPSAQAQSIAATLSDAEVENIVRRSYQYVAMYNTNNNFAMQEGNPLGTGGWILFQCWTCATMQL